MDSIDRLLKDISEAIEKHLDGQTKSATATVRVPVGSVDRPLYVLAVEALEHAGGKARAKDLQGVLRKNYNKRVGRSNLYMALDYARRQFKTVEKKRGVWQTVVN
jgi:hypothetical protein